MRKTYVVTIAASFTLSLIVSACNNRPSEGDCKKFADHMVTLLEKGQPLTEAEDKAYIDTMKVELAKSCVENGSKASVDCVLKAQSPEEADKCLEAATKIQ